MASMVTSRSDQSHTGKPTLSLAFELGLEQWTLGVTTGVAQRPRERSMTAGEVQAVLAEVARAKRRFELPEDARVVSCSEAGRDEFGLHRFRVAHGLENPVVDSSSLEVNRRQQRAKTARLDVHKLLTMLLGYLAGEQQGWRGVRVPSVADEDRRQLHRELLTAKRDRTRATKRIRERLAGQEVRTALRGDVPAQLRQLQQWDRAPRLPALQARLEHEWQKVRFLTEQIEALEDARRVLWRTRTEPVVEQVRRLSTWRGSGPNSAWLDVMECFAWRAFRHRKQVGAWAGLPPTPQQSGQSRPELGIVKAGKRHLRAMALELAWGWLRCQPESERSR